MVPCEAWRNEIVNNETLTKKSENNQVSNNILMDKQNYINSGTILFRYKTVDMPGEIVMNK